LYTFLIFSLKVSGPGQTQGQDYKIGIC
jgi:hypothetical protein